MPQTLVQIDDALISSRQIMQMLPELIAIVSLIFESYRQKIYKSRPIPLTMWLMAFLMLHKNGVLINPGSRVSS